MKISRIALAVALAPCLPLAEAASRNDALQLSDTLITANRDVQKRADSTTASSVFTRADIERLRPTNVLELLTHVPGVQVANYGGRGANYGLYIRGTSTAQSLVLIDGVRVGSATIGGASLQYLSVDQIERIEVLRGSRSAIYGADAMGGVVQIFTRRSSGLGLNPTVRIAGGSDGTWERSLGLSGGDERTRFNLTAALEETQGFDRTRTSYPEDADHDGYRNRSLSGTLSHQLTDDIEVGLSVLDQRGKTEFDNPFGRWDNTTFTSNPSKPYDEYSVSSSSAYLDARINDLWSSRIELGHSEDKQENFDKLYAGSTVNNTYRDTVSWLNTLSLGNGHSLRAGAEYLNDKVRSSNNFAQNDRDNQALFAQHSFEGEHFSTELGMRHDDNEQFGSENTFNGALTLPVNADNQLILSYAEGFRVPTFADLYWPYDSGYQGNPNLKPETSKSYELQWRSQLSETATLEASLYRTDFRNLIAYVSDPVTWESTMDNVSRARIHGFEASLKQELFGWQTDLGISIIDPRDRETGHTLPNRARRTLNFDVDRQFGSIGVGASFSAVSSSYANAANSSKLAGYGVLDLRTSWKASDELSFDLKWNNALDKDYSRLVYSYQGKEYGYQETPSAVMLGMTWTPSL
ncbi:TonB-dependent receptor domain-containing protein [Pseudomonas sp. TTU2014-080ASC]|uniref:TonB-dependent receptor domain-containing protein n=1 Tax=Pseudomonas sp. TTU2014-080ASC TaxID=1729724 RepID=UPI0007184FDF|nr:TonB-dependent receptor [Pseudomonas sp. TTU2014-080ASC]KRW57830.1 TonB-dependent receptor [Pseudomonas sp. TTU2014-080ASC]